MLKAIKAIWGFFICLRIALRKRKKAKQKERERIEMLIRLSKDIGIDLIKGDKD